MKQLKVLSDRLTTFPCQAVNYLYSSSEDGATCSSQFAGIRQVSFSGLIKSKHRAIKYSGPVNNTTNTSSPFSAGRYVPPRLFSSPK